MRSITASICKTDIMCNINIDRMLLTYFEDKDWGGNLYQLQPGWLSGYPSRLGTGWPSYEMQFAINILNLSCSCPSVLMRMKILDLALNNVKPKDWHFDVD